MIPAAAIAQDDIAHWRRRLPAAFGRPWPARLGQAAFWAAFAALTLFALWRVDADPLRLWNGLAKLGFLIALMLPPSTGGAFLEFARALLETLSMAFLGTFIAAMVAVPLGFLGARNVVPQYLPRFMLRRGFDGMRAVGQLIWALIFVAAVGMGPFAGILAIAASDVGVLAKLYAEAIENIDRRQVEGVRAAGGGWSASLRFGILPQVLPIFLSNALYMFESNLRSASILGIVGAGGVGLYLGDRIGANDWDVVACLLLMILVTVSAIDVLSARIRRLFI